MAIFSNAASSFGADDVVGGYELLRQIGKGGMAEVWVARKQNSKSKYVAIKVILPHLAGDERITRMFTSEANLSSQLSHSNIVQVFDIGSDNGIEYLVMEWVDGINLVALREALAHVELEERYEIAAFVVGQLLHALSYAHRITTHEGEGLAIVHRDVSPQNILVSNAGDVKLTDFGVAHTAIDESSGLHIKGKIRYMSPEQMAGQTRQCTIDLYAAGAILHELVTGKRFRGEIDDSRVLHGQILGGVVPPMPLALPPELEKVRIALLQADVADRVQTAEAAIEMLSEFRGYRDKRRALSKMCGALTGIMRPRTGPGAGMRGTPTPTPGPAAGTPAPQGPSTEQLEQQLMAGRPGTPVTAPTTLLDAQAGPVASTLTNQPLGSSVAEQAPMPAAPRRTGQVFLLVGIGVVLALGGALGMAWWILNGRQPDAVDSVAQAQSAAAADPGAKPAAVVSPVSPSPADALVIGEPALAQPAAVIDPPAAAPATLLAAAPPASEPEESPPTVEPEPEPEPEPEAARTPKPRSKPRSRARSGAKGPKPEKPATPEPAASKGAPVLVHLRLEKVSEGWVKVGGKTLKIRGGTSVRISSGKHTVYKKHSEDDPFSKCGTLNLAPGKEWKLFVGPTHCRAVAFGS